MHHPRVPLRHISTESASKETVRKPTASRAWSRRFRKAVLATSAALVLFAGFIYVSDTRASIHKYALVPLIRLVYTDAEDAHHAGVDTLSTLYKYGLHPRERGDPDSDGSLVTEVIILAKSR